jgi:hypothetical protein
MIIRPSNPVLDHGIPLVPIETDLWNLKPLLLSESLSEIETSDNGCNNMYFINITKYFYKHYVPVVPCCHRADFAASKPSRKIPVRWESSLRPKLEDTETAAPD